jgi:hypothetical protein
VGAEDDRLPFALALVKSKRAIEQVLREDFSPFQVLRFQVLREDFSPFQVLREDFSPHNFKE